MNFCIDQYLIIYGPDLVIFTSTFDLDEYDQSGLSDDNGNENLSLQNDLRLEMVDISNKFGLPLLHAIFSNIL